MFCEYCGSPISDNEYDYLSENVEYEKEGAYIIHQTCRFSEKGKPNKIIESHGSLILVQEIPDSVSEGE